jgi:hypothetical protein
MNEVMRILNALDWDDGRAAQRPLELLYDDLRQLAQLRLAERNDKSLVG